MKQCSQGSIVCTRLICIDIPEEKEKRDEEVEERGPMEPLLCDSETFHDITFNEPNWPVDSNYAGFQEIVDVYVVASLTEAQRKTGLKVKVMASYFVEYVASNVGLQDKVKSMCQETKFWTNASRRYNLKINFCKKVGRADLCQKFHDDTK